MAKYLLLLLLLFLKSNNVLAACYANQWVAGVPVYSSLFVDGGTTMAQCQAVACQAFPGISDQCPPTCQASSESQAGTCPSGYQGTVTISRLSTCPTPYSQPVWGPWTETPNCQPIIRTEQQSLSCPVHTTGSFIQQRTVIANVPGPWQTIQNSCLQDTPTCQTTTQNQTLACQTGYTGAITQIKTTTCPNPYGAPISGPWLTLSNTCAKSSINPLNPVSPVSPINPNSILSPSSKQSSTDSVTIQQQNNPSSGQGGLSVPVAMGLGIATTDRAQKDAEQSGKEKQQNNSPKIGLGAVLSMEIFIKPSIKQGNMFPSANINQQLPDEIKYSNQLFMDLYGTELPNQSRKLQQIQQDSVEIEQ